MQELVGRLTALDPEASETLKVVAYFDVLVAGGVGLQALLRGAAVLSGAVAGATDGRRTYRLRPDGDPLPDEVDLEPRWPVRRINGGRVWLERVGAPHANDEMVVERLALAVDLVGARGPGRPDSALEIALDAARDPEERRVALSRLRIDPAREVRAAALPLSHVPENVPSTVVATPHGLVRAMVLGRDATVPGPAGIGVARRGDELPDSFRTAVLALRLLPTGAVDTRLVDAPVVDAPVVDAGELGILLTAVSALEPVAAQQPDVAALARLDGRTRAVLDELTGSESVRAAATALGMHHSTLQARHEALTHELGYDPRSRDGRVRYRLARLLLRLVEDRYRLSGPEPG